MCGIVGYVGKQDAKGILLEGLKRLEYRGYDSTGIALYDADKGKIVRFRAPGKISNLEEKLRTAFFYSRIGIGHTRWATHGVPNESNAHPHQSGPFVVVHNGIIENYGELKEELSKYGYTFESETDTEVIVKLVDYYYSQEKDVLRSLLKALSRLRGTYGLVMLCKETPDTVYAARKDSPVVVGLGDDENYVASDIPAILPYTRKVVYLEDDDIAVVGSDDIKFFNQNGEPVLRFFEVVDWNPVMAEKGHYKHFMQKEIFEQPRAISDTIKPYIHINTGRVDLPYAQKLDKYFSMVEKILFIACGTSYHAALVGKYIFEDFLKVPCEVDLASEFRYRKVLVNTKTLAVAISQSGETADTRGAVKMCRDLGAMTCSIVNVLGSSISRLTDAVIYTHAGPEIGVASTKGFSTQLAALILMALYGSRIRGVNPADGSLTKSLLEIPGRLEVVLRESSKLRSWARVMAYSNNALYLGRHLLFPIALEGALKLKEISYIHAEGYAAGEMKHGPIALIDEHMPVICLIQKGAVFEKMKSNLEEVRSRGGKIFIVADESLQSSLSDFDNFVFWLPSTHYLLTPLLFVVPLQLLAYYTALEKGTDVDQPRNLAKSVTVE